MCMYISPRGLGCGGAMVPFYLSAIAVLAMVNGKGAHYANRVEILGLQFKEEGP